MESPVRRPRNRARLTPEQDFLLARFRSGERDAFQALLRPHLGSLQGLARRIAGDLHWAEDLLQETLVRAFSGLARFRGEAALRTWLFRILIRLGSEPQRWRRRERAASIGDFDIPDALGPQPDTAVVDRELRDRMQEAMERLPPRQRTALHLRAAEGMDYRAIAETLECSAAAARMLVLEARRRMMERMGRYLRP